MSLIIDEVNYASEEQEVDVRDKSTSQKAEGDIKLTKSIRTKCINCNNYFTQERKRGVRSSR